jgi:F420-0:gamma-glutamyl ligase
MNLADDLAATAHLVMGETAESTPIVLIRGAPIEVTDDFDPDEVVIPKDECMYMRVFSACALKMK